MLHRKWLPIILLIVLALVLALPTFAQDTTPEPAATAIVTPAPTDDGNPPVVVEQPSTLNVLLDKAFNVLLLLAVVFLAFKQSALIPPDVLDNVMSKLFNYAKEVTTKIPGDADDVLLGITEEVIRRWIKEEQAKQNPPPSAN